MTGAGPGRGHGQDHATRRCKPGTGTGTGTAPTSFCMFSTKALLPLRAMVPRLDTSSSRVMPTPLSARVMVLALSSVVMWISRGLELSAMSVPVTYTQAPRGKVQRAHPTQQMPPTPPTRPTPAPRTRTTHLKQANLLQRVRSIGHQLPNKHQLVRVQAVGDNLQQLSGLCLERQLLTWGRGQGMAQDSHASPTAWTCECQGRTGEWCPLPRAVPWAPASHVAQAN